MKKYFLIVFFLFAAAAAFSDQIPKIGIINYTRVMSEISGSSRALQEIDRMIKSYEDGIASIRKDIATLEERKLYYLNSNDEFNALKMDEQIGKKEEYLKEYSRVRLKSIEDRRSRVMVSPEFLGEVLDKIEFVAESEGYSIIFNSRDPNLIWWSQTVDITDKVIQILKTRN